MSVLKAFEYEQLDSTQTEAWRLVDGQTPKPFYVHAKDQSAGRGRMGRKWEGERGRSLLLSLVCEVELKSMPGLSLGVGLFAAEYFSSLPLQLKWPNDLMLYDSKVGGILIESRIHGPLAEVVIGIGINEDGIPNTNYRGVGQSIPPAEFAIFIHDRLLDFLRLGFASFRSAYQARLWRNQQKITYLLGNEQKEVLIRGIDETGQLLIEDNQVLELRSTGEIALV